MKTPLVLLIGTLFLSACSESGNVTTASSAISSETASSISSSTNQRTDFIYEGLKGAYEILSASLVDIESGDGPTIDSNTRAIAITMNYTNTTPTPRIPQDAFQSDFIVNQEVPITDDSTVDKDKGMRIMLGEEYTYQKDSEAYESIKAGRTEIEPGKTVEIVVTYSLGQLESWRNYSDTESAIHVISTNRGEEKFEVLFDIVQAADNEVIPGQVIYSSNDSDWVYQSIGGAYRVTSVEELTDGKKNVLRINMEYTNTYDTPIIPYEAIQSDFVVEKESDVAIEQLRFSEASYKLPDEVDGEPAEEAFLMTQKNIKVGATVNISVKLVLDSSPGVLYLRNNTGQGIVGVNGNVYEKEIAKISE